MAESRSRVGNGLAAYSVRLNSTQSALPVFDADGVLLGIITLDWQSLLLLASEIWTWRAAVENEVRLELRDDDESRVDKSGPMGTKQAQKGGSCYGTVAD